MLPERLDPDVTGQVRLDCPARAVHIGRLLGALRRLCRLRCNSGWNRQDRRSGAYRREYSVARSASRGRPVDIAVALFSPIRSAHSSLPASVALSGNESASEAARLASLLRSR